MIKYNPWSSVILKDNFQLDNWDDIKPKLDVLFNSVERNSQHELNGGISTVTLSNNNAKTNINNETPLHWPEFETLKYWIHSKIDEVVAEWNLQKQTYMPLMSWVNRHCTGAYTGEHTHRGAHIIAVYYLQMPENSGRLLVRDPLEYHWGGLPSNLRGIEDFWYPIDIKTGDLVFFPSWLPHKTEINKSNDDRYVMSINYTGVL